MRTIAIRLIVRGTQIRGRGSATSIEPPKSTIVDGSASATHSGGSTAMTARTNSELMHWRLCSLPRAVPAMPNT